MFWTSLVISFVFFCVLFLQVYVVDSCYWLRHVLIYFCNDCTKVFVRSLQGYILGWRLWQWQKLRWIRRNGIGGYIYRTLGHPDRSKGGTVYLAPVNVSCWVELHGEKRARVPRSTEILISRSRGKFETGVHQNLSGWLMDVFPNHFSAVVSTSKYWSPPL